MSKKQKKNTLGRKYVDFSHKRREKFKTSIRNTSSTTRNKRYIKKKKKKKKKKK